MIGSQSQIFGSFMRLTSFTDFALRTLMRLAGEPTRSFATHEIATEFRISRNHLAKVVRDLDPGMMLYPTGDKMGVWWKVTDELGNEGWAVSTNFQLAH